LGKAADPKVAGDYKIIGNKIRVSFFCTDGGLAVRGGGALRGFVVAGADGVFYEAQARIVGTEVEVSSPKVARPVAARYAWGDYPADANLVNGEGLPASPFRTDGWE
jgi:sialate O-acetylesterase